MDRKKVIGYITGNSKGWKGQEKLLQALPDPQLASLARGVRDSVVANSARKGFFIPEGSDSGNYVYDDAGKLVRNDGGPAAADGPGKKLGAKFIQAGGPESDLNDDEFDPDDVTPPKVVQGPTGAKTVNSLSQWRSTAPPEVVEIVDNAMRVNKTIRTRLLERLTANARDDDHRKRLTANYSKFSTEALQDAVAAMPEAQTNNAFMESPIEGADDLNFLGGAGGPLVNAAASEESEVAPPQTLNYQEIASERLVSRLKTG